MADCTLDSDDLFVLSDTDRRKQDCNFEKGSTLRFFYAGDNDPANSEHKKEIKMKPLSCRHLP